MIFICQAVISLAVLQLLGILIDKKLIGFINQFAVDIFARCLAIIVFDMKVSGWTLKPKTCKGNYI